VLQEALDGHPLTDAEAGPGGPVGERVDRVRRYIEAHLSEPGDLAELSRTFSISPYHLSRVFRDRVGVPPHRYLTNLRVARAKELLATSTMSVTQVAARVGFGSLSHSRRRSEGWRGSPPRRTGGRGPVEVDENTVRSPVVASVGLTSPADICGFA
jgi:transcriptional regulator GlxA family with amidase domain